MNGLESCGQKESDVMELKLFAVALTEKKSRPIALFQSLEDSEVKIPVWMTTSDLREAYFRNLDNQQDASAHDLTLAIFSRLDVEIQSCTFNRQKGHRQFAEVRLRAGERDLVLEMQADKVLPLCMKLEVPFYCTRSFFKKAKELEELVDNSIPNQGLHPLLRDFQNPYVN